MSFTSAQLFRAGYSRLKTTSGCLTCRRRRKKCDENKPICRGCTRNRLACNWSPEKAEIHQRRRAEATVACEADIKHDALFISKHHVLDTSQLYQTSLTRPPSSLVPGSFGSVSTSLIHDDLHFFLLSYCINYYLPIQVHQHPGHDPVDQSYLISMSLFSPPLMDALFACAALTFRSSSKAWHSFAVKCYVSSLREIGLRIADGTFVGPEDCLLAITMWLCIFENSRLDGRCSKSGTHLDGLSKLLRLRKPMDRVQSSSAALSFERICVEYFIYHSAILMLFDHTVDPTRNVEELQRKYEACLTSEERSLSSQASHSPVLGAPHQMFRMIISATQLARMPSAALTGASLAARLQYGQLVELQGNLDQDILCEGKWPGRLYALAARILLLKAFCSVEDLQLESQTAKLSAVASESLRQLSIQLLGRVFGKYWLWPLAIIGSIMTKKEDINLARDKLDAISNRTHGNAVRAIRYTLESIWAGASEFGRDYYSLEGLSQLLDGENMDRTLSLLSLWAEDSASSSENIN